MTRLKNCESVIISRLFLQVSVYVDGLHLHTQKLHYISAYPGGATASPGFPISVYAYVGTPPQLRYCQETKTI